LAGIGKFAHLVNVDFFQDLTKVLKELISLDTDDTRDAERVVEPVKDFRNAPHRLHCIVTAFELLSGQGEKLPWSLFLLTHF